MRLVLPPRQRTLLKYWSEIHISNLLNDIVRGGRVYQALTYLVISVTLYDYVITYWPHWRHSTSFCLFLERLQSQQRLRRKYNTECVYILMRGSNIIYVCICLNEWHEEKWNISHQPLHLVCWSSRICFVHSPRSTAPEPTTMQTKLNDSTWIAMNVKEKSLRCIDLSSVPVSVNTDFVGGASAAAVQPLWQLLLQLQEFQVALWALLTDVEDDLKPFKQLPQNLHSAQLNSLAQVVLIHWKIKINK